jgi:selenoprotein W-related protein
LASSDERLPVHCVSKKGNPMKNVSITYCKPCGYEKRAAEAAAALREKLALTATLVPGKGGIFEVRVDGEIVARRVKGHFPETTEIVKTVSAVVTGGSRH